MRNPPATWSSSETRIGDRTDALEAALSRSYHSFQVLQRLPPTFQACLRQHALGGAGIVEAVCDPCMGQRTRRQVRSDDDACLAIQLTTSGRERLRIGDARLEVAAGDLLVVSTDRVLQFEVVERLHKVTLMVPWSLVRDRLPGQRNLPAAGKIDSRSGAGSLLAAQLRALPTEIPVLDPSAHGPVSRSTLELLCGVLSGVTTGAAFDAGAAMLQRVQDYILQNLAHDDLTPRRIASAHRLSLRYLHLLFQHSGTTVSGFILDSRLHACCQALADPAFARSKISDIASRWGFHSASHFCRAFKGKYGASPSEVRKAGHESPGMPISAP